MASLHVRNAPDDMYKKLQQLAVSQHREGSRSSHYFVRASLATADTATKREYKTGCTRNVG